MKKREQATFDLIHEVELDSYDVKNMNTLMIPLFADMALSLAAIADCLETMNQSEGK